MGSSIDFKDLWSKQTVSPPDINELLVKLKQFKNKGIRKLILTSILLVATIGFVAFIWYIFQPQLITTKIGITLTILAMLVFMFFYSKLAVSYKAIDGQQSNTEYLQNLIAIQVKQKFLQSRVLSLYFILLGTGICLYLYEYALKMPLYIAIATYFVTLSWFALNWFYLRPKQVKKERDKINDLISKFEVLTKQFED
ncbi:MULTISPECIES: hypothetical protein [unclassified Flavobacterium]|uniref:hypothetical protein n=1 Tax=unclassified Flavobacterium TaxID=196869 RepID=UPI00131E6389|nr:MULTISPECIES: hypothetical protein [unclassified Flavobacterium]